MAAANVFVLGLDDWNHQVLCELPDAAGYHFRPLLSVRELQRGEEIPLARLLARAEHQLESFDGPVDAVIGYWNFPVSSMVPLLCARFGLRSASLESVVKCEHKYWCRLEQQKVIKEYPRFALIDLDESDAPPPSLDYPLWLKPVKSFGSELAFHVTNTEEFRAAVHDIREGIARIGEPFAFVLDHLDLPPEIAEVGAQACLAEEQLRGRQVTVEGYSHERHVRVYGVVDSVTFPGRPSFLRYQYPSTLPAPVSERMAAISRRVITQLRLDHTTFNIEFFYDPEADTIGLLEVNPRHSQSHARLFEQVDGVANHQCMVQLALGRTPTFPHGEGPYAVAAKWFVRSFADGVVRRSPTPADVAAVERSVPGVTVRLLVRNGVRLSELRGQDAYSYQLAHVFVGADSEAELIAKYEQCVAALPFEIAEVS
jgi:biotin carboxylase